MYKKIYMLYSLTFASFHHFCLVLFYLVHSEPGHMDEILRAGSKSLLQDIVHILDLFLIMLILCIELFRFTENTYEVSQILIIVSFLSGKGIIKV